MTTILVTGASGQLGQELQVLATQYTDWKFVFCNRQDLDITNHSAIDAIFEQYQFDYCINCAAYTAVDKAESDLELATAINTTAVGYLASACQSYDTQLIHISTDYVYHNSQNHPFQETDTTSPKGVYAQTKLDGEVLAAQNCPQTMIIRTSWVYSSFGHNFVKTMLRLGKDRDKLTVIFDQIGSPTYAADLADAILQCIKQNFAKTIDQTELKGVYHYSNEGVCSWYDFALAIFELEDISCHVAPIETKDYPTPAKRPHFSLLNKNKIKTAFNLNIPHWRTSLKDCLTKLH
ncbi:MAG: dTDP-4-dehydrorhamnose reductase [Aureispira sp.]|nr:dTDP-4-dehydrorhamnose reductase [Aureispira sp.]